MPNLERPESAEWRERDITIVPRGDAYVVRMPSVLTPARVAKNVPFKYADSGSDKEDSDSLSDLDSSTGSEEALRRREEETRREESDVYREYRETDEQFLAMRREQEESHARSMDELYERGLVLEYDKLALQQPHQRGSRAAHTAMEQEFYETVNWEYQGPSPRVSNSPRHSSSGQRSASPRNGGESLHGSQASYGSSPRNADRVGSPRRSPAADGGDGGDGDEAPFEQLDLTVAGRTSPRQFSPRTCMQMDAVKAVAGIRMTSPFASPRSKEAAKAMLLDQAEVTSILTRVNNQRNSMRVPTAASFAPDLEERNIPPGAVAKKPPITNREKYKTPTERTDRNVLRWFAEHGSAKRSLKTMSRGPGPNRKEFKHDWRSPSGCEWKLGQETSASGQHAHSQLGRRPRSQGTPSVLGSYGGWSSSGAGGGGGGGGGGAQARRAEGWRPGGLAEQDCLWNQVAEKSSQQAAAVAAGGGGGRPFTASRSSAVLW